LDKSYKSANLLKSSLLIIAKQYTIGIAQNPLSQKASCSCIPLRAIKRIPA